MSPAVKARMVSVETLPRLPSDSAVAVAVSSSGASKISTPSWRPIVQYAATILAPSFCADSANAASRFRVSLTFFSPCCVQFSKLMYVGMRVSPGAACLLGPTNRLDENIRLRHVLVRHLDQLGVDLDLLN